MSKIAIAAVFLLASGLQPMAHSQQAPLSKKEVSEIETRLEASLYVAKRVCADRPADAVWIYRGAWAFLPCNQLQPVFDIDQDNIFEAVGKLRDDFLKSQQPKDAQ